MRKIFASNNRRLRLVSFDNDSIVLNLSEDNDENIPFPNIQELKINLDSIQILPRLFTLLPNPQRLHACVEKSSHEEDLSKLFANLSPLIYLTDFQLRFVDFAEMFDTIASILNQMPFLETFTFDLWTNDERLVNGKAHSQIDHLLKSWPNHMRVNYSLNEDDSCLLFYTMPWLFTFNYHISKDNDVTCLNDIIPIVKHLHPLHTLAVDVDVENQPENATSLTQSIRLRLPWLKKLENNQELFSLHIVGSMSAETTENLQEWLVHHSDLTREHSFAVAYQKNWFSLWW
ncbi:unnamed protein product [Rotaria magnacalcarata]